MGRLIPAGTGLSLYKKMGIDIDNTADQGSEMQQINAISDKKNLDMQVMS
jgi:hypothetical protein